jgi:TonB family protein
VLFVLCLSIGGFVLLIGTDKQMPRERQPVRVALLRPPAAVEKPTPPAEQKRPQPPVPENQTIIPPPSTMQPREGGNPKGDDKPAALGPLGVEGEGGPGSDAFGLVGRGKGGRELTSLGTGPAGTIGGDRDRASVMRRYGGYYRLLQDEMRKGIIKRLESQKTVPQGRLQILVWLSLEDGGSVADYRITRSSGSDAVDEAVKEYLSHAHMQAPPPGMPRDVSIRFTY